MHRALDEHAAVVRQGYKMWGYLLGSSGARCKSRHSKGAFMGALPSRKLGRMHIQHHSH